MVALAVSACALGPVSSAGAATPLDQVTTQALGAVGQVTEQVDATLNRTGAAVDRVEQATVPVLHAVDPVDAGRAVDTAPAATGRGIDVARQPTATPSRTLAAGPPEARPGASASIHETPEPAGTHRLRLTSRRHEGAATSARAGVGIEAARGRAASAPAAQHSPAGAERRESAGTPSLVLEIPGTGLGIGDGSAATGATALLLTAFALVLLVGGLVPPALRSTLRLTAGVRGSPPLILALDRPG